MDNGVQRQYAANSICFGCGPANGHGLQINSYRTAQGLEMRFTPSEEHQAFPGMVNGGIIGTLMDTELVITAFAEEINEDRVNIRMELKAGEKICATGKGLFVAVKEGHPAYHRWN